MITRVAGTPYEHTDIELEGSEDSHQFLRIKLKSRCCKTPNTDQKAELCSCMQAVIMDCSTHLLELSCNDTIAGGLEYAALLRYKTGAEKPTHLSLGSDAEKNIEQNPLLVARGGTRLPCIAGISFFTPIHDLSRSLATVLHMDRELCCQGPMLATQESVYPWRARAMIRW